MILALLNCCWITRLNIATVPSRYGSEDGTLARSVKIGLSKWTAYEIMQMGVDLHNLAGDCA